MIGTKGVLLGGAAVSLALATIAASDLPAQAQQASDVATCAEFEGDALEACIEAEADAEAVEDEPEQPVLEEAEGEVAAEPAEPIVDEAGDEQGETDQNESEPEAVEETEGADEVEAADAPEEVEEVQREQLEETEAEAVEDQAVDVPDAADGNEVEAEAVEESETVDEVEAAEGGEPELSEESEDEAVDVPEAADEVEAEPDAEPVEETEVEAVEDEVNGVSEADVEAEAEAEAEAETVDEIEATDGVEAAEEPEVVEEDEAIGQPEVVDEVEATDQLGAADAVETLDDEAVDEAEATETEAEAVDPEDVLTEEELEAAQQESIEAAVQAALAAERQKPQAQQETERDDRMRILGAAAAGLAAGALLPQIGAMLVGQQGDRVILQQDERLIVRRDETSRFLQEGSDVSVEDFADGVTLVTVMRPDGSQVLSWRDASGQVVRRVRVLPDGREITLFDGLDTAGQPDIQVTELPPIRREDQRRAFLSGASAEELLRVLSAQPVSAVEDRFTLRQILANDRIRWLMPSLALDAVTFDTGSATLGVEGIEALDTMGRTLREMVETDPQEVFLVEGHTDAVGSDILNLALSDRRAETVATLLSAYYDVPPENLVVQGFGEQDLRVPTLAASRDNRRVEVRRITPLLR